jgi:hypothetical protein
MEEREHREALCTDQPSSVVGRTLRLCRDFFTETDSSLPSLRRVKKGTRVYIRTVRELVCLHIISTRGTTNFGTRWAKGVGNLESLSVLVLYLHKQLGRTTRVDWEICWLVDYLYLAA